MQTRQSKIDFNVIYCSSEDASHPVQNLQTHLKGWLSGKFPDEPQELILQPRSQNIETLYEIQILTTAKLPSPLAIDIFVFVPNANEASQTSLQLSRVAFQKVGSLQFSSSNNSTEGVQVKSAFLNHDFFLLKLQMHGCQSLNDNVFRQMGIQGLYLIGKGYQVADINLSDEMLYQDFIL